jgi:cadmium resistance protein CadD (predicted permease)
MNGHTEIASALAAAAAGVTTFAATNVDDLLLLTVFFARRVSLRLAMTGQYLGFSLIVAISLTGFWAAHAISPHWFRFLGLLPLAIGLKHLLQARKSGIQPPRNYSVLSIAAITFINGADNVGIYVPFFAVSSRYLGLILIIYALLLPAWCLLGKWLGERPIILRSVDRYGHWIVPAIFVSVGLYILI